MNPLLLLCALVLPVHAGSLADARAAERDGSWNAAAALYRDLVAEGSGPAGRRMAWLQARQDGDGDWDGLEALARAQRGQGAEAAQALLDDDAISTLVRQEAALWLAGQALDAGDPGAALTLTEDPWAARGGLPRPVLGQVVQHRAAALSALERFDDAREVEAVLALETAAVRPSETDRAERAALHQAISLGSALVALFVVIGLLPAAWAGWRRSPRPRPWGLVPLMLMLTGTAVIAELRVDGAGRWWAPLSLTAGAVHLLSAGAGRDRGRLGRVVVGTAAAVATLALAWVSLWATDSLMDVGL